MKYNVFEVDTHFGTSHIEKAYCRFVDIFLQAAYIPALNAYEHFPPAKKLLQNANGWKNENVEQLFFPDAYESLWGDINEDSIYIFDKFNKYTHQNVAEPQPDIIAETYVDAIVSTDQPVALPVNMTPISQTSSDIQHGFIQIDFKLIAAKGQIKHIYWAFVVMIARDIVP